MRLCDSKAVWQCDSVAVAMAVKGVYNVFWMNQVAPRTPAPWRAVGRRLAHGSDDESIPRQEKEEPFANRIRELPRCHTATLSHCHSAILSLCHIGTLPHCETATLPDYHITTL